MRSADLLIDAFGRVRENVHGAVSGLTDDELAERLDGAANSIAWLIWHLTRVQDDHVCEVAEVDQAWSSLGWAQRFGLPFAESDTGFGHGSDDVAMVRASAADLLGYHDAVYERTVRFLDGVTDQDLDRIVDDSWDPPVSLGVRLVSVADEGSQHSGQAAYIRGILLRRR